MNYARFYALLGRLPVHTEDMKEQFVLQYTDNRTSSLREMSTQEYKAMCDALENSLKDDYSLRREELRRHRSTALHIMQRLGIDTTDWVRINAFCLDARIAGKPFAVLGIGELDDLVVKLRGIERKGGIRPHQETPPQTTKTTVVVFDTQPGNHLVN